MKLREVILEEIREIDAVFHAVSIDFENCGEDIIVPLNYECEVFETGKITFPE